LKVGLSAPDTRRLCLGHCGLPAGFPHAFDEALIENMMSQAATVALARQGNGYHWVKHFSGFNPI
jgi:hypothetical protein